MSTSSSSICKRVPWVLGDQHPPRGAGRAVGPSTRLRCGTQRGTLRPRGLLSAAPRPHKVDHWSTGTRCPASTTSIASSARCNCWLRPITWSAPAHLERVEYREVQAVVTGHLLHWEWGNTIEVPHADRDASPPCSGPQGARAASKKQHEAADGRCPADAWLRQLATWSVPAATRPLLPPRGQACTCSKPCDRSPGRAHRRGAGRKKPCPAQVDWVPDVCELRCPGCPAKAEGGGRDRRRRCGRRDVVRGPGTPMVLDQISDLRGIDFDVLQQRRYVLVPQLGRPAGPAAAGAAGGRAAVVSMEPESPRPTSPLTWLEAKSKTCCRLKPPRPMVGVNTR